MKQLHGSCYWIYEWIVEYWVLRSGKWVYKLRDKWDHWIGVNKEGRLSVTEIRLETPSRSDWKVDNLRFEDREVKRGCLQPSGWTWNEKHKAFTWRLMAHKRHGVLCLCSGDAQWSLRLSQGMPREQPASAREDVLIGLFPDILCEDKILPK